MKKLLSAIIACVLVVLTADAAISQVAAAENDSGLKKDVQQGTVLHCFVWRFDDIRKELPDIAEAGFSAVQTSPVQLSFYGGEWSIYYSPFGFAINPESALGTKEELRALCDEAEKYGIRIIVDVVGNHLAPFREFWDDGYGEYIESLELFDNKYLEDKYWHNHGNIRSYYNRSEITSGDMHRYLPDLNTENAEVQADVKALVTELKGLGVDGIRWDAAKHIALPSEGCGFWPNVIDSDMYNYGEILGGPTNTNTTDALMKEYTEYMSVTDSAYGASLMNMFKDGKAPALDGNWTKRGVSADKLMYWAETHDTYCSDQTTHEVSQNAVDRAYAVAASRQGASALYYSRPLEYYGEAFTGEKGSTHFKSAEVAAVNHFHNAMGNKADCYTAANNCAVVTRDGGGAVLALGSGSGEVSVPNGNSYVPEGSYVDEISGNVFNVTKDTINGKIGECGIAVFYRLATQPSTQAEITEQISTTQAAADNMQQSTIQEKETEQATPKDSELIETTSKSTFDSALPKATPSSADNGGAGNNGAVNGGAINTGESLSMIVYVTCLITALAAAWFFFRRKSEDN